MPHSRSLTRTNRLLTAALLLASLTVVPFALPHAGAGQQFPSREGVADPDVDRQEVPEDIYAMALGCYEMANAATGEVLGAAGGVYQDGAGTPFHFEPTGLGTYLLLDTSDTVVAAEQGAAEELDGLVSDVEYVAPVGRTTDVPRSLRDDAPAVLADDPLDELPDVDTHTGAVVAGEPGPSADWRVTDNGDGTMTFTLPAASGRALAVEDGVAVVAADASSPAAAFSLRGVDEARCAEWPEVEVNVDGPVLAGETPWDEAEGFVDAHLHLMAYEFLGGEIRCGQPWHPYGVLFAMGDCYDNEVAGGRPAEVVLTQNGGSDEMWPSFTVPAHDTLTYEQVYHRWLERAWRGGLRMMTVLMVENNTLCEVYPEKRNSCNEMDSVRLQVQRLHEFVDYLDARAGGPGQGWAQIATDPFQAREIINSGRLAFVMGIEVSVLFDCREHMGASQCTDADIRDSLDEVQELGITQLELVNKFDNALSGVKGDGGTTSYLVNNGNREDTGHYWRMTTCGPERGFPGTDRTQPLVAEQANGTPFEPVARDPLAGMILEAVGTSGAAPLYPEGPHCNTAGLTAQGELALREIASRGLLFDPDHMSALAADQALTFMEQLDYTGLVSSHGWADDGIYQRILQQGGFVTPYAGGSSGFVSNWRTHRNWINDDYYFGFGYGADMNGFGGQGGPRNPAPGEGVTYPFTVPGGAVVHQQVSGTRAPYDINTDGVAHYGLYPDWVADLQVQAGEDILRDMLRGPEAYLQVWERAIGVPRDQCTFGIDGADLTGGLREGMTVEQALLTAGQPRVRAADGYTWCGELPNGNTLLVTAAFDEDGRIASITRTAANPTEPLPPVNPVDNVATGDVSFVRTDVTHVHGSDHDH